MQVNGSQYGGAWENDKKNGLGFFIWPPGDAFSGTFINDIRDGQGMVWNGIVLFVLLAYIYIILFPSSD